MKRIFLITWVCLLFSACDVAYAQTLNIIFFTGGEATATSSTNYMYAGPTGGNGTEPNGFTYNQHGDFDGVLPHTGNNSLWFQSNTFTNFSAFQQEVAIDFGQFGLTHDKFWGPVYFNTWIRFVGNNGQAARIVGIEKSFPHATAQFALQWTAANKFALEIDGTVKATSTNTLPLNTWLFCEMFTTWGNSSVTTTIKLNGETLTDHTGISATDSIGTFEIGWLDQVGNNTTSGIIQFDNLILAITAEPDTSARVGSCLVSSDNAIGNWLTGSGGNTNLVGAFTLPPKGATSEDNTTQIKNTNASGADNYDVNMQSYITAGMPAGKKVYAVQASVRTAEKAHGSAIVGTVSIISNPNQGSSTSFNYGFNAGAYANENYGYICGVRPNPACVNPFWYNFAGPITLNPSVSNGNSPIIRVQKTTATASEVDVDYIELKYIYVTSSSYQTGQILKGK